MTVAKGEDWPRRTRPSHPLLSLPEEELDFIVQFVLASGSLKEMAALNQVSYPTIRARLDRVIAELQASLQGVRADPVTNLLADLVERGEIKVGAAKAIRSAHRKVLENYAKGEETE
jgi:hypothetical protein